MQVPEASTPRAYNRTWGTEMAEKKHLLVTLDDASVERIDTVVASLKKAGLTNVKKMETIGIVSGEAAASAVAKLKKVEGVKAVEESEWTQLPSPDSPIQ
jgi:hypothetical protein